MGKPFHPSVLIIDTLLVFLELRLMTDKIYQQWK